MSFTTWTPPPWIQTSLRSCKYNAIITLRKTKKQKQNKILARYAFNHCLGGIMKRCPKCPKCSKFIYLYSDDPKKLQEARAWHDRVFCRQILTPSTPPPPPPEVKVDDPGKFFIMSTEFDKNISDWSHDCTDHKNGNDFFMSLVKWPKIAVKKSQFF